MKQQDEIAGGEVLAGVKVPGSGSARRMMGGATRLLFAKGPKPSPLQLRQIGHLAVTADRLLRRHELGHIAFTDGTGWVLEGTKPNAGRARELAALIADGRRDRSQPEA
ncbi:MAG: hypothetical protein ACRD0A_08650 [Acidimicrobiales bacterium]